MGTGRSIDIEDISNSFYNDLELFVVSKATYLLLKVFEHIVRSSKLFLHVILSLLTSFFLKSVYFFFSRSDVLLKLLHLSFKSSELKSHRALVHVLAHLA